MLRILIAAVLMAAAGCAGLGKEMRVNSFTSEYQKSFSRTETAFASCMQGENPGNLKAFQDAARPLKEAVNPRSQGFDLVIAIEMHKFCQKKPERWRAELPERYRKAVAVAFANLTEQGRYPLFRDLDLPTNLRRHRAHVYSVYASCYDAGERSSVPSPVAGVFGEYARVLDEPCAAGIFDRRGNRPKKTYRQLADQITKAVHIYVVNITGDRLSTLLLS